MFFWQLQDESSHEYNILRGPARVRVDLGKWLPATAWRQRVL